VSGNHLSFDHVSVVKLFFFVTYTFTVKFNQKFTVFTTMVTLSPDTKINFSNSVPFDNVLVRKYFIYSDFTE